MNDAAMMALFGTFAVVLGLPIGSFLNVVIRRIPEDRSLWHPSACPHCSHPVRWRDLVPVASWIVLRGRCRDCGAPISPTYPMVEALTGMVAWLVFRRVVSTPADLDAAHLVAWVALFAFSALLIAATYVDLRWRIIPDETSIYAVPFGVAGALAMGVAGYTGWPGVSWQESILGAAIGGGTFAVIAVVAFFILRREGLGWGDAKMLAMIGAFVGPVPGLLMVALVASVLGMLAAFAHIAITRRRAYLPFGPWLSLAALAYLLYGDVLTPRLLPGVWAWAQLMDL